MCAGHVGSWDEGHSIPSKLLSLKVTAEWPGLVLGASSGTHMERAGATETLGQGPPFLGGPYKGLGIHETLTE